MIDVNEITAKLAQLPDAALQQYASMHKNDPYMVSLAISESNRRKAMRQAAQKPAAPQGSVVDREISGIAMLPAEMGMADGGIVAFAAGSDAPVGYNEMMRQQQERKGSIYSPYFGLPRAERERLAAEEARRKKEQEDYEAAQAAEARRRVFDARRNKSMDMPEPPAPRSLPPGVVIPPNLYSQGDMGMEAPLAREPGAASTAEGQTPAGGAGAAAPGAISVPPPRTREQMYESLRETEEFLRGRARPEEDAIRKRMEDSAAERKKGLAALIEESEAGRPKEPALKEREEKLREQTARGPEERKQAINEALVMAGLGMLAGTSQYAGVNIGQGALAGMKNYQSSMKELREAADKRDDLLDKIELSRRAEAQGDADRKFKYGALALDGARDLEKMQIDFLTKRLGATEDQAKFIAEMESREQAAARSAQTQLAVAREYASGRTSGRSAADLRAQLSSLELRRKALKDQINTADKSFAKDPKTGVYLKDSVPRLTAELAQIEREAAEIQDMLRGQLNLPARSTTSASTAVPVTGWGDMRTR